MNSMMASPAMTMLEPHASPHGFTYSGHPVAAAVARESIAILLEEDIPNHVRTTAPTLMAGLDPLRDKDAVIDTLAPLDAAQGGEMATAVMDEVARQGVLVRAAGDNIILAPPLISTAAEITEITDRLRAAYDAVVGAALPRMGR
jgi:4-aminobutyrate--pyruvate transaminase